jgi:hypothetical protein
MPNVACHICGLSLNISEHKKTKALDMSTATALWILLLAAPLVYGSVQHIVGGTGGWSQGRIHLVTSSN